jgi:nodulation protein E
VTRVLVTGLGSVSAFGVGVDRFWEQLVSGHSGIRALFGPLAGQTKVGLGAQIQGYSPAEHFSPIDLPLLDPFSQYALIAAREAVADAGLTTEQLQAAALVLGTGCGGKETDEQTYQRLCNNQKARLHPCTIPRGMPSAAVSQISIDLAVQGPTFSVTSACASAGHAAAQAAMLISCGCADVAVTGGTDAPFTFGLLRAWEALRVLSKDGCRPFSANRNGIVLGEGAGILILESESHARRRSARVYAELAGFGLSSDASHITDPNSRGAESAMRAALQSAGLATGEVDYVNAHGTGTRANDRTETHALRAVFGSHADNLLVSSTKAAHGHALGASGALESIASVLAIYNGLVPPTLGLDCPGDGCDLDYVPNRTREVPVRAALSNSFAFGGLNAVIALRCYP